jgi:hypothetical protein
MVRCRDDQLKIRQETSMRAMSKAVHKAFILFSGVAVWNSAVLTVIDGTEPGDPIARRTIGIAAKYPNDVGIARASGIIFADDFESWGGDGTTKPADKWHGMRLNETSLTRAVPGNIGAAGGQGPGERILEIACWHEKGKSQVGGLWLKLGNYNHANEGLGDGYDELYVRYYIKFDENYRGVQNHGSNLGGRDVTVKDAAWVGMAGIRDVSTRGYFYSGLQPYGKQGSRELEMGFYSYHLDKKGPWGENYEVRRRIPIRVGTWHCVERHMKLNSVDRSTGEANADGLEELWIDGELSIRKEGVRFRRVPHLRVTSFSLETYYHGLPEVFSRANPIKVYFDNVVIARTYVGPITTKDLEHRRLDSRQ